jgi:hypothetical protein
MNYAIFQDTYHIDTTFVEFYGIISAIPRHWRHLINTCHNLIYKENRFIHQLQIDPCHFNPILQAGRCIIDFDMTI